MRNLWEHGSGHGGELKEWGKTIQSKVKGRGISGASEGKAGGGDLNDIRIDWRWEDSGDRGSQF